MRLPKWEEKGAWDKYRKDRQYKWVSSKENKNEKPEWETRNQENVVSDTKIFKEEKSGQML